MVGLTKRSSCRFGLDAVKVTRIPGPHSSRFINDCLRRILEIKACRVGHGGYWIMHPGGAEDTTEYFWQVTTEIRRIESCGRGVAESESSRPKARSPLRAVGT